MAVPEPTEQVYPPRPSWLPALVAAGLAGLIVGIYTWWPYGVIGAAVMLLALWRWLRGTGTEISRLPRRQRVSTSPIPLKPSE